MHPFFRLSIGFVFLCSALAPYSTTYGATVDFADQEGQTVLFTEIVEVNGSADPSYSLFGSVSATNNTLDFDSFNLRAETRDGFVAQNGRLSLSASSKPGSLITGITVSESGFSSTFGDAFTNIDLGGSITIDGDRSANLSTSFTKTSEPGDGFVSEFWEREFSFSFDPTDEVRVDLNNMLFASSGIASLGTLESNGLLIRFSTSPGTIEGSIDISAVPEPGSALAICCMAGLFAARRRRSAA